MSVKRQFFEATQTVRLEGDVTDFKAGMHVRLIRPEDWTDAELIGVLLERHGSLGAIADAAYQVALEFTQGHQVKAAQFLGVTHRAVTYQVRRLKDGKPGRWRSATEGEE